MRSEFGTTWIEKELASDASLGKKGFTLLLQPRWHPTSTSRRRVIWRLDDIHKMSLNETHIFESDEIAGLLARVPKPPGEKLPKGVSDRDIDAAEASLGLKFPPSLRAWLKVCNGPCVGPGGIFGIHTNRRSLDMSGILALHPVWKEKGWIPVAGDGCGNYYVLACKETSGRQPPVYFVDTSDDPVKPAYIVASSLGRFLRFLLNRELGHTAWPFRKEYVLAVDPELQNFKEVPLPWSA